MSLAVVNAIKAHALAFSDCPIFWPNETIAKPTDANGNPAPFVLADFTTLRSEIIAIGAGPGTHALRDDGFIRFHIFVPENTGLDMALSLADSLATLFRGIAPMTGLQTLAPSPPDSGAQSDDGLYYGVSFSVPYYYLYQG